MARGDRGSRAAGGASLHAGDDEFGAIRQTVSVMSMVARWCKQLERGEEPKPCWLVFHARNSSQPPGYLCAWSDDRERALAQACAIPRAIVCRLEPGDVVASGEPARHGDGAHQCGSEQ
jgi:hypothetical protein